jgi:hypothetical protein
MYVLLLQQGTKFRFQTKQELKLYFAIFNICIDIKGKDMSLQYEQ